MLKKFFLTLICILSFFEIGRSQDLTLNPRDTLYLNKGTHIANVLADWDSVVAQVMRGSNLVQRIKLTKYATGEYGGTFKPTYTGNYVAIYYAYYSTYKVREEEYFSVLDTEAFMGAASGLTAGEISDSIRVILLGLGLLPAGSDTFDLYIFNEDTIAQEGVTITIYNMAKTAKVNPSLTTNVNGKVQTRLDPDSYQLNIQRIGVVMDKWDTITVPSGGGRDTIWVTSFDPGSPPSGDLCLIYGFVKDFGDVLVAGARVEVSIPKNNLRYGTVLISPYMKQTTTDATGYWHMNVYPNSLLTPTGTKYHIKVTKPSGVIMEKDFTVPDVDSWEITW
jgi:hypothetical protein